MSKPIAITGALLMLLFSTHAGAAAEYLRVQGTVGGDYGPAHQGYDASYDLASGQSIHFDFVVDTAMESPGRPDGEFSDFFFADYAGGSVAGDDDYYGVDFQFPEGMTTFLFLRSGLSVGGPFEDDNGWDKTISTWVLGTRLFLMSYGHDFDAVIGSLTLTYRADSAPPPIPIPGTVWLLGGAIAGLRCIGRRCLS